MTLFAGWTIRRAQGLGVATGCAALILWLAGIAFDGLLMPLLAALAVTGFCGLSVLWMTVVDFFVHGPRGERLRPVRIFDVIVGIGLAAPSLAKLGELLPSSLA